MSQFLHLKGFKAQKIQTEAELVCEDSCHMRLLHDEVESPNLQHVSRRRTTGQNAAEQCGKLINFNHYEALQTKVVGDASVAVAIKWAWRKIA